MKIYYISKKCYLHGKEQVKQVEWQGKHVLELLDAVPSGHSATH